jgi:glutathione synthase/RimK-type ligase-like ATP-grasp enzyme
MHTSSKPLISLITYSGLPDLDPDDRLVQTELARRGVEAVPAIWNDPTIDWSKSSFSILRSTWDYHLHYLQFLSWAEQVSAQTELLNPLPMIKWNSKKTYLADLHEAGLPVIPTAWIHDSKGPSLVQILQENQWNEAIIKPSIGLATAGVKRTNLENADNDQVHVEMLLRSSEVMVQEYLPSVHQYGERALIFIDGEYSHTVRKAPFQILAAAGQAGESRAQCNAQEIEIAKSFLDYLDTTPLYARVDLVRDAANQALLLELELVEPSLFLAFAPESAEKFAEAILRRIS